MNFVVKMGAKVRKKKKNGHTGMAERGRRGHWGSEFRIAATRVGTTPRCCNPRRRWMSVNCCTDLFPKYSSLSPLACTMSLSGIRRNFLEKSPCSPIYSVSSPSFPALRRDTATRFIVTRRDLSILVDGVSRLLLVP